MSLLNPRSVGEIAVWRGLILVVSALLLSAAIVVWA